MTYDPNIWFQISRGARVVARFPPGKTVQDIVVEFGEKINPRLREDHIGDQYLRCYAPQSDQAHLTREEFEEYRKAGGACYMTWWGNQKRVGNPATMTHAMQVTRLQQEAEQWRARAEHAEKLLAATYAGREDDTAASIRRFLGR